jgi:arylsulfatase A-like enzyme
MAEEGIRFTDFYMASPVCSPSRGAMMTGCYPRRIGFATFDGQWVLFPGMGLGLNPEENTIASLLKKEDYATMIVGKWHCGDQPEFMPTNYGFDHYYGIPYSNDMGRQVGRAQQTPLPLMLDDEVIEQQPEQAGLTERYMEQSLRFMRENRDQPFFLYLAHMYVHLPIYVQERFLRQAEGGPYGAAVECIDWVAGMLMHELKELGIDDNTVMIFTSDNGGNLRTTGSNAPLRGRKGETWEGGIRVPCVVRWPGQIPPGQVSNEVVTSMDFLPTLVQLAGGQVPAEPKIDGKDVTPLLTGQAGATSPCDAFYYYFKDQLEAVRAGKWKLFVRRREEEVLELYDLETDIGETTDLAEFYPEVVTELQSRIAECREDLGDSATGMDGANCRPVGRVDSPKTLCVYDENYPYYMAEYDLDDVG